jgi:Flp pilus assembly protein TadD
LGRADDALSAAQRAADLAPDSPVAQASVVRALLLKGRKQEAQKILAKLEAQPEPCRTCIADIYFVLGNVDRAVKYWEEEIQRTGFPAGGFYYPKTDPAYDAVRNQPLFVQLLRNLKLN